MSLSKIDIVMIGVKLAPQFTEYDLFYDDLEEYSSYARDKVTLVHDDMQGSYFYAGEVLSYSGDDYADFTFALDEFNEQEIWKAMIITSAFVEEKYGIKATPTVHYIRHIY